MKLLILDGNSVINRAFYGVKPLTTREGLFTNAIYGFLNILERMEREEQPEAVCVAFDMHGPTFRHLQYEGYKATRHGMPEELAMQMPVMKEVLKAMNIPVYECQGWEADDVIGTVGKICSNHNRECVIVTVPFSRSKRSAIGLPTILLLPITTHSLPAISMPDRFKS